MIDEDRLAETFEAHRSRLRAVAHRMLGSSSDADDAVQETRVRFGRAALDTVEDLGDWLTTAVARVALDMQRARRAERDAPAEPGGAPTVEQAAPVADPAEEPILAGTVGAAVLVALDTLAPAERLALVLHDTFAVPYDQIGDILGRSPTGAKQLAHRARRKVQSGTPPAGGVLPAGGDLPADVDPVHQRELVQAFLTAAGEGDFDTLVVLLDPDVVLEADAAAARMGSPAVLHGASDVAAMFSRQAAGAESALVDGAVGMVWVDAGRIGVVWDVAVVDGRIVHVDMLAAPGTLDDLDVTVLE